MCGDDLGSQFAKGHLFVGQSLVERVQVVLLLRRGRFDDRRGIAVLDRPPKFGDVIEIGKELVEFFLRERIELVLVAPAAAHRQALPDREGRLHAIDDVFGGVLLWNDSPFGIPPMIAVEAAGNLLFERSAR